MTIGQLAIIVVVPEVFNLIVGSSEYNMNRKSGLRILLFCFFTGWNLS